MTVWTPEAWSAAIAASRFELTAVYDGEVAERPAVPPGAAGTLLRHELALGAAR
jgi:hypothetical protein